MKILYIHQYFRTPQEGGPIRSYYLAKGLVDRGFEVEMITSYNGRKKLIKNIDGIKVHYLPVSYTNNMSFKRRLVSFLKFMYLAIDEASTVKGADICYATSTPLSIGLAAIKIKEKYGIPYIFEVRDLWPEAPIQMGALTNPWLLRYSEDLEQRIYSEAERIVALSPGMMSGVSKKNSDKELTMIPNMSDVDFFSLETKNQDLENKFGVRDQFVISYFGAIGKANKLDYFLDAAERSLQEKMPLKFLIVGDGSEKDRLEKTSQSRKLTNMNFLPFMNKAHLREMLNVTDAAYISFDKKPILETNSPNKYFDSLASGKLVVTNTKGWLKDLSEESTSGIYTDPEDPEDFVTKISSFVGDSTQLGEFQQNARRLGVEQFAKEDQVEKLIGVLTA